MRGGGKGRIDLIIEFNGKDIFGVLSGQDLREQCVTLLLEQLNRICLRLGGGLSPSARISMKLVIIDTQKNSSPTRGAQ